MVTGVSTYAIYLLASNGNVSSWNAGAQRLKGYSADEVMGKNFGMFFTEEDRRADLPQRALRIASEEGTFEVDTWRTRSDGSLFWGSVVIDAIRDIEGRLVGFAGITRDITERQLAAQALRTGMERYRTLLEGIADYAIYMLSKQGSVTSWNGGAARIIGYSADEILGSHFARFFTETDQDVDVPTATLHAAALEGRYEGEGWRVRADASRFWAHMVVEPVRSPSGHLLGFSVVTRDITEKRESALALERAREHLFQAQKLDALGKVTSGVAHDFNNLLGIIQSAAALLSREALTETGTQSLSTLKRAVDSGAGLTRELLLFARHQPLQDEEHDLNVLVRSFEPVLRQLVTARINYDSRLVATPTVVRIDATQFEAALLNLVSNAVDAMPEGGLHRNGSRYRDPSHRAVLHNQRAWARYRHGAGSGAGPCAKGRRRDGSGHCARQGDRCLLIPAHSRAFRRRTLEATAAGFPGAVVRSCFGVCRWPSGQWRSPLNRNLVGGWRMTVLRAYAWPAEGPGYRPKLLLVSSLTSSRPQSSEATAPAAPRKITTPM
jgi:PAS domain S-box-containing protein